jgi:dienelactone hydrolase
MARAGVRGKVELMTALATPSAAFDPSSRTLPPVSRRGAGRREALLFRAAMAAIALHALDYAFVDREPGTAAGDHLLSGLVPTALAVALAVAYPRLRAGLRASVALACGLVALTAGIAAPVRHAVSEGLGGDDATGILVALAGALLVAEGVVVLWRSRRLDEPHLRRYGRRVLIGIAAVVIAYEVVLPLAVTTVVTHRTRWAVPAADLGRPFESARLRTSDGVALAGWYVPSRNRAAVIVSPGRSAEVQKHARMLVRHGYGALVFDRRGEGRSEGDFNIFGWSGESDLRGGLAFLRARPDVDAARIGGLGLSVGGEMLLQTAAHTQALRAVVSEGAGVRSVSEQLHRSGAAKWQLLPQMAVMTAATAVLANDAPAPGLTDLVRRIAPRPVFFIYATHGQGGEELNPSYYARAGLPKTLWEIPDADHTGGLAAHPREYEQRVVGFFDRALLTTP